MADPIGVQDHEIAAGWKLKSIAPRPSLDHDVLRDATQARALQVRQLIHFSYDQQHLLAAHRGVARAGLLRYNADRCADHQDEEGTWRCRERDDE